MLKVNKKSEPEEFTKSEPPTTNTLTSARVTSVLTHLIKIKKPSKTFEIYH